MCIKIFGMCSATLAPDCRYSDISPTVRDSHSTVASLPPFHLSASLLGPPHARHRDLMINYSLGACNVPVDFQFFDTYPLLPPFIPLHVPSLVAEQLKAEVCN